MKGVTLSGFRNNSEAGVDERVSEVHNTTRSAGVLDALPLDLDPRRRRRRQSCYRALKPS